MQWTGFAVELYFDAPGEERLQRVCDAVGKVVKRSVLHEIGARPHVSLAVLDSVETGPLCHEIEQLAGTLPSMEVRLGSVATFPSTGGVVFLAPVVTPKLLELHRRFHTRLQAIGARSSDYYLPGNWVPHCTMALDLEPAEVPRAIEICQASDGIGEFVLNAIGLVEFVPVRDICMFPLQDNQEPSRMEPGQP